MNPMPATNTDLILRSRPQAGVSEDVATWFETRRCTALLTMRIN
jgi:hypothetical protein